MKRDALTVPPEREQGAVYPTSRAPTDRLYWFWDIETDTAQKPGESVLGFRLAVVLPVRIDGAGKVSRSKYAVCRKPEQVIELMRSSCSGRNNGRWIAHNTGFDLQHCRAIPELMEAGFELDTYYNKQTTTFIQMSKGRNRLVFYDTMNWFPVKLDELGHIVGTKKGKIDFDRCSDKELEAYCVRDVEVMVQAMAAYKKWYCQLSGREIGYTRGGDALNLALGLMHGRRPWRHCSKPQLQAEFAAYHGGRTECFRMGDLSGQEWAYIDVNSLYPYIMTTKRFAGMPYHGVRRADYEDAILNRDDLACVAEVDVSVNKPYLPYEGDRGLVFPVGEWTCWLTGNELKRAVQQGDVQNVRRAYFYRRNVDFRAVVNMLYEQRLEHRVQGRETEARNCKLLMNSIYGKFAQCVDSLDSYTVVDGQRDGVCQWISDDDGVDKTTKYINGRRYECTRSIISDHACPVISAEITADARLYMWDAIMQAGTQRVAYMDTDSLFLTPAGLRRMLPRLHDNALGRFKLEGVADDLHVYAPKYYHFNDSYKIRGVPKDASTVRDGVYRFKRFRTLTQSLGTTGHRTPAIRQAEARLKRENWKCESIDRHGYEPLCVYAVRP